MSRYAICRKVNGNITHIVIPKNNSYNGNYFILSNYSGNIRPEILMSCNQLMNYFHTFVIDDDHKFKSYNNLKNRLRSINSNGISDFVIIQKTNDGYVELDNTSTIVMNIKRDYYNKFPISDVISINDFLRIQSKSKYVVTFDFYKDNLYDINNVLTMYDEDEKEVLMQRYKNTSFYRKNPMNYFNNKKLMSIAINMFGIKGIKIIKRSRYKGSISISIDDEEALMQFKLRYGRTIHNIIDITDIRI